MCPVHSACRTKRLELAYGARKIVPPASPAVHRPTPPGGRKIEKPRAGMFGLRLPSGHSRPATNRDSFEPGNRFIYLGFRVAAVQSGAERGREKSGACRVGPEQQAERGSVWGPGAPRGPFSLLASVQTQSGTPLRTTRTAQNSSPANHPCRIVRAGRQPPIYKSLKNMQMCLVRLRSKIKTLPILCRHFCKPARGVTS